MMVPVKGILLFLQNQLPKFLDHCYAYGSLLCVKKHMRILSTTRWVIFLDTVTISVSVLVVLGGLDGDLKNDLLCPFRFLGES